MGKTLKSFADWRLQENMVEYSFYTRMFKRILFTMFKWDNLPCGISEHFIKDTLYNKGFIIFFKATKGYCKGNYVVAAATVQGYNLYEEPTVYHAHSVNNIINENVKASDCVVIYNDVLRMSSIPNVNYYAKRLSAIDKTIDINLEHLKQPYIVSCSEGQKETVKQIFAKKSNGEPYILVNKDFDANSNVFNLDIKNHTKDLLANKHAIISEALTFFGINNIEQNKKERMIVAEAEQNNEMISINKEVMYYPRLKAVKEINEKFKLNITCEIDYEGLAAELSNVGGSEDE